MEAGGLKQEKNDMEFQHQYFVQGKEHLLEHIKRKVRRLSRSAGVIRSHGQLDFLQKVYMVCNRACPPIHMQTQIVTHASMHKINTLAYTCTHKDFQSQVRLYVSSTQQTHTSTWTHRHINKCMHTHITHVHSNICTHTKQKKIHL